jgi:hypothetical protein
MEGWELIRLVYLDAKIRKQLMTLRKSGKKAAKAAEKAEGIIRELITQGVVAEDNKNAATKHGELRIDNCIKYNLGSGYRLITIKQRENLFLTFVGSHDDCDLWIENNRNFQPNPEISRFEIYPILEKIPDAGSEEKSLEDEFETDNEEPWEEEIDEKDLRVIFSGLTGEKH